MGYVKYPFHPAFLLPTAALTGDHRFIRRPVIISANFVLPNIFLQNHKKKKYKYKNKKNSNKRPLRPATKVSHATTLSEVASSSVRQPLRVQRRRQGAQRRRHAPRFDSVLAHGAHQSTLLNEAALSTQVWRYSLYSPKMGARGRASPTDYQNLIS